MTRWRPAATIAAIATLIVGAALVSRERRGPTPEPSREPGLVLRSGSPVTTDAGVEREEAEERALAVAIASVNPADRERLLDAMRSTTARLEARASGLGVDLDDDDPVGALMRELARHVPMVSAARSLDATTWYARDLTARPVSSCRTAHLEAGERCVALWPTGQDAGGDGEGERARFLAWAASRAFIVSFPDANAAASCARTLRSRITRDASSLALALLHDDLELTPVAERTELESVAKQLGRAMRANGIEESTHFEALAQPAPQGRVAAWLTLQVHEVLVVPRLSALVRIDEARREVSRACAR